MNSTRLPLAMIAALARNRVISLDNQMPWHLPADLRHFKTMTLGKPIIMGRKTWDFLGRPLPGRLNIVVTRDTGFVAEGASVAHSLETARGLCPAGSTAWVIGGAQIYAQALPLAREVVVTEIAQDFEGDAFAPVLGGEWREAARDEQVSASGLPFAFVTYRRADA